MSLDALAPDWPALNALNALLDEALALPCPERDAWLAALTQATIVVAIGWRVGAARYAALGGARDGLDRFRAVR